MHIANGTLPFEEGWEVLSLKLSDFYGLRLSIVRQSKNPLAQTKTSNKVVLQDVATARQYLLKERPIYLTKEKICFSVEVVIQCSVRSSLMVPVLAGKSGDRHFVHNGKYYVLMPMLVGEHLWSPTQDDAYFIGQELACLHEVMRSSNTSGFKGVELSSDLKEFSKLVTDNTIGLEHELHVFNRLIEQLACSTEYSQVIHGDISPSNLLLDKSNDFVFLDFDNISIGSIYYDLASLCQTFAHLKYQANSSHLTGEQSLDINTSIVESLIAGYSSRSTPIEVEAFIQHYHLVWLEHMLLGALREDFTRDKAKRWASHFDYIKDQVLNCFQEKSNVSTV
ncbi:phosphotransferase enzyme family protein [Vibrio campbellii]|uniref:Aminoglycoside phosphotransferase domain-containing protein n=1 Tax=Vibrio campbellii (strain ATCC BAA-1116) TaxID=2902295 RepID=A7N2D6_VIBC1|nr:phosphotransferase [Vibrio campbellii]ABU73959.1 hypothetical protein VIBHAR_06066 [Vibrio campbellii ATCC BAA-1116]AGU98468.1 hypothetical protein M892_21575 [Vibrio campbellii ATCC BAA-1116]MBT0124170.1 phosphotransferase [Vibrio campbellii]MBT0139102.1 phosphotransferase [Vibrio campbellii]MBT0143802.1 phosphotransferase [Vibrio campbellii]